MIYLSWSYLSFRVRAACVALQSLWLLGRAHAFNIFSERYIFFFFYLASDRPTPQESELDNFGVPSARLGEVPIVHAITYRMLTASSFVPVRSEGIDGFCVFIVIIC